MPSLSPGLLAITGIRVEMPRRYQRKTNRGSWSQENLTLSKEAIASGVSIKRAFTTFGIPRSILHDHVFQKVVSSKLGPRKTLFTVEQKAEIMQHLLDLENRFYGIAKIDVRKLAFELAGRNGIACS
ncbi:uncharacterized protein LOC129776605 isoform X1 [Toxorhynchites rutilus septentrionalis]|uniref:uncharacterized protein LOC129776605 isoform X1 n=1 Tax=Toxorhynchites rutilus septentrionalis TaxID=329112 RepID=UPI0024786851|nr:uncharacterized protein LOC129776605 isoform X1 [Toxorhynchites rutilus septentrionalis]